VWDDPVVREQIVRYAIDEEVARGLSPLWTQWPPPTATPRRAQCLHQAVQLGRGAGADWGMIELHGPQEH